MLTVAPFLKNGTGEKKKEGRKGQKPTAES